MSVESKAKVITRHTSDVTHYTSHVTHFLPSQACYATASCYRGRVEAQVPVHHFKHRNPPIIHQAHITSHVIQQASLSRCLRSPSLVSFPATACSTTPNTAPTSTAPATTVHCNLHTIICMSCSSALLQPLCSLPFNSFSFFYFEPKNHFFSFVRLQSAACPPHSDRGASDEEHAKTMEVRRQPVF
jgi:hypothetical protein